MKVISIISSNSWQENKYSRGKMGEDGEHLGKIGQMHPWSSYTYLHTSIPTFFSLIFADVLKLIKYRVL